MGFFIVLWLNLLPFVLKRIFCEIILKNFSSDYSVNMTGFYDVAVNKIYTLLTGLVYRFLHVCKHSLQSRMNLFVKISLNTGFLSGSKIAN